MRNLRPFDRCLLMPVLLVLCLPAVEHACAGEKDDTPYEYSAFGVTKGAGFEWANGSKSMRSGFGPDALFMESAGEWALQVKTGRCIFVEDVTPIEFTAWLTPTGHTELVLSAGAEGPSFDQWFVHDLWVDTGLAEHNVGKVQVTGIKLSRKESDESWAEVRSTGKPIKIAYGEVVHFRLRLDFNDEERKRIFKQGDTARLQFVVGIDIGRIPGNEELATALANRKGRPKELYMSTVAFTIVKKDRAKDDPAVAAALANWRIRRARLDPKAEWSGYEELLRIQPVNEAALFAYARSLEKGKETDRAIKILEKLIETIQMRPNSTHHITSIDPMDLIEEHRPREPDDLIKGLKYWIASLQKRN